MKSKKRAADISIEWYNHYVQNQLLGATPALTDKSIQEKIVRATKSLNLTNRCKVEQDMIHKTWL
jgi:hypothetical protein